MPPSASLTEMDFNCTRTLKIILIRELILFVMGDIFFMSNLHQTILTLFIIQL